MNKDRVALNKELEIFHRVPPAEEKEHFVIGMSCCCHPSLEIVGENIVIVDHKMIAPVVMQESRP